MQEDISAFSRALLARRKRAPGNCVRCGAEFPPSYAGDKHKRLYCSQRCRQATYLEHHPEAQERAKRRAQERARARKATAPARPAPPAAGGTDA